jgi:hypothetical protein
VKGSTARACGLSAVDLVAQRVDSDLLCLLDPAYVRDGGDPETSECG